jgi:dimethylaniline monooxygenase (N-oxide forming)
MPRSTDRRVAVIGAGPGGLAAAKHLLETGLTPLVLEAADDIGGQWHAAGEHSAIWPGMRTNTSRTTTAFSDFPPPPSTPGFPRAEDVHAYLREYARHFGVDEHVRTRAAVTRVDRGEDGWSVRWSEPDGEHTERFDAVVLATGRYRRPRLPAIPGLAALLEAGRARHSSTYPGRTPYSGRRVLVYGNSISGLEIASELAADPTISVISAARRPRYVIQKIVRGLPADWRWFSRLSALLAAALPPDELAAGFRAGVLAEAGDPGAWGAPSPDPEAPPKLSMSQDWLTYAAEGRIDIRPGIDSLEDGTARFADGSEAEIDAVICATGYHVDVSVLAEDVRAALRPDDTGLDLHARTFHPDVPGLAVLGQFNLIGPHLPTLELQARWVAAVWSGAVPRPTAGRLRAGVDEHRMMRELGVPDMYPGLAGLLAGELGVEPDPAAHPDLAEGLLFGPLAPARYRLEGPGARPEAAAHLRTALSDFALPPAAEAQIGALAMAAGALGDAGLAAVAERLGAGAAVAA